MSFKISEMIIAIFLFTGKEGYKKFVPEMIFYTPLIGTFLSYRKKRVAYFKGLVSKISCQQCGVINTIATIVANINDEVGDIVLAQRPEGLRKNLFNP